MVGSGFHQEESMSSRQQDDFLNLERKQDRESSTHTTHTGKSHSRVRNHVSQEQNKRAMQREIDNLKKRMCHAQQKRTPSSFDVSSNDEGMLVTDKGQELHQASLSPTMKSTTTSKDTRARLVKA